MQRVGGIFQTRKTHQHTYLSVVTAPWSRSPTNIPTTNVAKVSKTTYTFRPVIRCGILPTTATSAGGSITVSIASMAPVAGDKCCCSPVRVVTILPCLNARPELGKHTFERKLTELEPCSPWKGFGSSNLYTERLVYHLSGYVFKLARLTAPPFTPRDEEERPFPIGCTRRENELRYSTSIPSPPCPSMFAARLKLVFKALT